MSIAYASTQKSLMILAIIALISISASLGTQRAAAAKSTMTFQFLAGSGLLCSLEETACPDIAKAPNGDTISISGSGTLSVFPKSVSGSGTFTHKNAAGAVLATGTWTANQLIEFVSYGNATPQGLPANLFGGRALIMVTIFVGSTPVHTAILQISCQLGTPPTGVDEGIRLNVQDAINFNDEVSGDTVFIAS